MDTRSLPSLKKIIDTQSNGDLLQIFPEFKDYEWMQPHNRIAIDAWLYLQRAKEELQRLAIELPRVMHFLETACSRSISQLSTFTAHEKQRAKAVVKKFVDAYERCSRSLLNVSAEWPSEMDAPVYSYNSEILREWQNGAWRAGCDADEEEQIGEDDASTEDESGDVNWEDESELADITIDEAITNVEEEIGDLHLDIADDSDSDAGSDNY